MDVAMALPSDWRLSRRSMRRAIAEHARELLAIKADLESVNRRIRELENPEGCYGSDTRSTSTFAGGSTDRR